jgi:hypothetical protein
MNKPKLEHIEKAIEYMGVPVGCNSALWFIGVNTRINEIALAEQQEIEYITAAQARELGAGNAEWLQPYYNEWCVCDESCRYAVELKYRAIPDSWIPLYTHPAPFIPITADMVTDEMVAAYGANFNSWDTPTYSEQIEAAVNAYMGSKK